VEFILGVWSLNWLGLGFCLKLIVSLELIVEFGWKIFENQKTAVHVPCLFFDQVHIKKHEVECIGCEHLLKECMKGVI